MRRRRHHRHRGLGPDVLDREVRVLLDGEIEAAGRGDYAEALRLNSLRLGIVERRRAELFRRFGPAAGPGWAPA